MMNGAATARRLTVLVLGALLGLLMLQSTAVAHNRRFATQISASYDGTAFTGSVRSGNPDCLPGRTVTLFERQVGGGAVPVGSATTDAGGNFSIALPGADGQFFVQVGAVLLADDDDDDGYGHTHVCNGARSGVIRAGSGILGGAQDDDDDDGDDDGDGAAGGLPFTGGEPTAFVIAGLGLIAIGTFLVRRRRASSHRVPSS